MTTEEHIKKLQAAGWGLVKAEYIGGWIEVTFHIHDIDQDAADKINRLIPDLRNYEVRELPI